MMNLASRSVSQSASATDSREWHAHIMAHLLPFDMGDSLSKDIKRSELTGILDLGYKDMTEFVRCAPSPALRMATVID